MVAEISNASVIALLAAGAGTLVWQGTVAIPKEVQAAPATSGQEGNPFYARFSPDGRRVLYTDNGRGEQSGIWFVDADGKVEWAVDMSKPNFVGREAVLRRLDEGVKMRLVGLELGANWPIPRKDDRILCGSKPIGAITNARYSPTFNMNLARAWTESAHAEKDARVEVTGADGMYPARIAHTYRRYDPTNRRVRS